ncbi:MAG: tyrosyl-tRNA synthetase, partial [Mariniblastus sp.]
MIDIFEDLKWRGLIHQTTADDKIPAWLNSGSRTLYAGFDPTADSLHVGSLLPLMMLRRFQKAGHRPIAIAGGATGMIGDPSGKSAERNLQTQEQLDKNLAGIEFQMRHVLDFDCGENSAILVDNNDWMSKFSYTEFLRDVGKNFPVN